MPPRLYHTKSKTGCVRCRIRRVKVTTNNRLNPMNKGWFTSGTNIREEQCDETRPVCGACQRHQVDCVYDREAGQTTPSPPSAASSAGTHHVDHLGESRDRRYRELRLLHFFTVNVCPELPGTCVPEALETWREFAPRQAFTYEPLLNAVLALSIHAMQRKGLEPESESRDLTTHRARYMEATLQDHRKAVGSLTRETADAVCLTSALISIDAFAGMQGREIEPYKPPIEWLQLSRGVRDVFTTVRPMVINNPNSKVKAMMEYGQDFMNAFLVGFEGYRAKFAHLLDSHSNSPGSSKDHDAYGFTVGYIGSVWAAYEDGQHPLMLARRLLVFSIIIRPRYLELLTDLEPLALVILAHYFAVAMTCRQLWWVGRSPSREILAIDAYLGPGWRHVMQWPLEMAERWPSPTGLNSTGSKMDR